MKDQKTRRVDVCRAAKRADSENIIISNTLNNIYLKYHLNFFENVMQIVCIPVLCHMYHSIPVLRYLYFYVIVITQISQYLKSINITLIQMYQFSIHM